MKKQIFVTLLIVFMGIAEVKASGHDIEVKNADGVTIYYKWINNKTELAVSHRGSDWDSYDNEYFGNVVIPPSVEYNGKIYRVTSIGYEAFYDCYRLTSVIIPEGVTSIESGAFRGTGLTSIIIPNGVTSIDAEVFEGCGSLTSISIPNSVTYIDENTFSGTSWYRNQPDGLVYAGKVAYKYKGEMPHNTIFSSIEPFCNLFIMRQFLASVNIR